VAAGLPAPGASSTALALALLIVLG